MYKVAVSSTAIRDLRKLPTNDRKRILDRLDVLAADPLRARPRADIHPLGGEKVGKYRIRIGAYRAVYAVVGDQVVILEVFHRGRGYR